jgi:hypothetical protein
VGRLYHRVAVTTRHAASVLVRENEEEVGGLHENFVNLLAIEIASGSRPPAWTGYLVREGGLRG